MSPKSAGRLTILSVAVAGASAAATKVVSNDLWWHLATGRWIASGGRIPREEFFSFTSAGAAWIDHGWLWQILAWLIHDAAGLSGLAAFKMACAAAVAAAGFAVLRASGWGLHGASALILVCVAGARFRFLDRPETAGLALLAVYLLALCLPGLSRTARLCLALPTVIVWANVHASALLAPALAGAAFIGGIFGGLRARHAGHPDAGRLTTGSLDAALLAAASAAALLVNPYGWSLLLVPSRLAGILETRKLVNPEWLAPEVSTFPLFYLVLFALIFLGARRIVGRLHPSTWRGFLPFCVAAYLGVSSARHLGIFFCAVPFAVALAGRPHGYAGPRARPGTRRLLWSLIPAGWAPAWGLAAALVFPLWAPAPNPEPGFGLVEGRFPEKEADYIGENLPPSRRLFNDVAHGGYLIWRFYPESSVFIDGRNEVHGKLLEELAGAVDDGRRWQELLERHGIDSALVRYREALIEIAGAGAPRRRSWAALHFPRNRWALVHWGEAGMVFLKRGAGLDDRIDRDEYEFVHPEDWRHQLEICREGSDPVLCAGIRSDLDRRLSEPSPPGRARELQDLFEAL